MTKTQYDVDICIIGAGSGGLSVASGAAQLGRSVVLFEAEEMGGDCLNYGCVPSKALIAAGKHAHAFSTGSEFGVKPSKPEINFTTVKKHIQGVIDHIAPVDSQERFEGLGCTVIRERARFKDATTVESDTTEVKAKRFVIATGSRASAPPIPGLSDVPYLTNETIFSVKTQPKKLLIIGAGPIGLELGQSFLRLGSKVAIVDISAPLGRSEPEHASFLVEALREEGIEFHTPAKTKKIRKTKTGVAIDFEDGTSLTGSHLLVAAGRAPAIKDLNLEAAGIDYDRGGVLVSDALRSSNKRVYVAGDAAKGMGGLTHAAGFHAGQLIRNFYFSPPYMGDMLSSAKTDRMPAAIYTAPELASIGLTEAAAKEAGHNVRCVSWDFEENDRAIAERSDKGHVKIVATTKGKILGASIVADGAGELLHMISIAMTNKVKISGLAQIISPYPTRSEAVKRAASSWYTDALFSDKTRKIAGFLTKFQ